VKDICQPIWSVLQGAGIDNVHGANTGAEKSTFYKPHQHLLTNGCDVTLTKHSGNDQRIAMVKFSIRDL